MTITIGTTNRFESGTKRTIAYPSQVAPAEFGMRHRANIHDRQARTWNVTYDTMNESEFTAIHSELQTAKGSAGRLNFVPPGESYTIPVRFVAGSFRGGKSTPVEYKLSFQLTEDVRI